GVVSVSQPIEIARFNIPDNVYNPIMQGLTGVPTKAGTAGAAFDGFNLAAYGLAGKTGTAQVQSKADTSLFVAFGPTAAPQYVTAVVLEQSGFGADAAAPVLRPGLHQLAH